MSRFSITRSAVEINRTLPNKPFSVVKQSGAGMKRPSESQSAVSDGLGLGLLRR
ncbi:hypothetical protein [Chelonobacter oris]|uniref:hypothetical protein n=1 Tax=Chelonobacter oris TaxID=505317 RepID=UPI001377366C|nr:hypothetical protein [Chelonobacter oris]